MSIESAIVSKDLGNYVVTPVNKPFRYAGAHAEPEPDVIALIHELAHIFGAEHVDDRASIMHEDLGYRTEFDARTEALSRKISLVLLPKTERAFILPKNSIEASSC